MDLSLIQLGYLAVAILVLATLLIGVAGVILWRLRRRPAPLIAPPVDLSLDVSRLPASGPVANGTVLECYGVPVRLAAIVLAPVGRSGAVPSDPNEWPRLFDSLIPGLMEVVATDQPVIRFWPPQLSSQGFTHTFFHQVALPGAKGKGTPWSSIAGRFEFSGQQYLAGIVCCAAVANGIGQVIVQHQGLWLDVLRVRRM